MYIYLARIVLFFTAVDFRRIVFAFSQFAVSQWRRWRWEEICNYFFSSAPPNARWSLETRNTPICDSRNLSADPLADPLLLPWHGARLHGRLAETLMEPKRDNRVIEN